MSSAGALGPRTSAQRIWTGIGFVAVVLFSLGPALVMLTTAFNARANAGSRSLVPSHLTLDNFAFVLDEGKFGTYLRNSVIVAFATVLISGALALFAAVAVSRFRFRFRTAILVMVLVIQMVPVEALVIPLFIEARTLGLLNHLLGLVVVYVAFSLPFAIWTLRGFVAGVPRELEEAAYVDGASWPRMFWHILFPLVAPGLIATSVYSFITAWNEFVFAITYVNDDTKYTAAAGLRQFFTQYSTNWGGVMAGSTLLTVPVMVFFLLVQRRLGEGMAAGAVKG